VEFGPERLGVREEGIEPRDERRTPKVRGRPAVGLHRGGSRKCERGGLKEGEHAGYEEPSVSNDLSWEKVVREIETQLTRDGVRETRAKESMGKTQ